MFMRTLACLLVIVSACFASDAVEPKHPPRWSHIQIHTATLLTGSGAPVELRDLMVDLPPKAFKGKKPSVIRSGDAFLTSEALTRIVNDKIGSAAIQDLKVETEDGDRAKISGKMHKAGIPLPINIEGPVTLTPQGLLRVEIQSEKSGDIPIKGLAKMLGMSPEKAMKTKPGAPVRVEKDAILIDASALLGTAQGKVTHASVSSKGLLLHFGSDKKQTGNEKKETGSEKKQTGSEKVNRKK